MLQVVTATENPVPDQLDDDDPMDAGRGCDGKCGGAAAAEQWTSREHAPVR